MFQATPTEFKAAIVARCFIVGFRYFRQSDANQARLAYTMANEVQSEALGEVLPLSEFSITNMLKLFTSIATAHQIEAPANWAARVLLLSSPMFMSSAAIVVAAGVEVSAATKEALLVEFERHLDRAGVEFEHYLSIGGTAPLAGLFCLAIQGNTRLSRTFRQYAPNICLTIFDEDGYEGAANDRPVLPELMTEWRAALTLRRRYQREAYEAAQTPSVDDLADMSNDTPEFDENLNREDIEAQYTCNAPEASETEDDVDL